jgi:hypothetical protein
MKVVPGEARQLGSSFQTCTFKDVALEFDAIADSVVEVFLVEKQK